MTTGDKIAQKRKENNLTQDGLASLLDVSRQAVSRWESGLAYPETDKLIKMSRIFNCTVDWLLKDDSDYVTEQTEQLKKTESIDENTDQISKDTDCKGKTKNRQDAIDCIISGGNGTQKILAVLAACVAMAGVLAILILNFFTGTNLLVV